MRAAAGWCWLGIAALASTIAGPDSTMRDANAREADSAIERAARLVPTENLLGYLEFRGLADNDEAWKRTAAYKTYYETGLAPLYEDVARQILDWLAATRPEGGGPFDENGAVAEKIARHARDHGFVASIAGDPEAAAPDAILVVFPEMGRAAFRAELEAFLNRVSEGRRTRAGEKTVWPLPGMAGGGFGGIWFEGDDLVIGTGRADLPTVLAAAAAGRIDNAAGSEPRKRMLARSREGGAAPFVAGFVDLSRLETSDQVRALGLDGLKGLEITVGFKGEAIAVDARLLAPAPRRGLLRLIEQPGFTAKDLPPIPTNVRDFTAISIDLNQLLNVAIDTANQFDPQAGAGIEQVLDGVRNQLNIDVREEILGQLGPKTAIYVLPPEPTDALGLLFLTIPKATVVTELRDRDAFLATLEKIIPQINGALGAIGSPIATRGFQAPPPDYLKPRPGTLNAEFRKLKAGDGYVLQVPVGVAPLPAGLKPTIRVGRRHAVFAVSPEAAETAIAAEAAGKSWASDPENAKLLAGIRGPSTLLSVTDPRDTTPQMLANMPAIVQFFGLASMADGPATGFAGRPQTPPLVLQIDPESVPSIAELRRHLFPNVVSGRVDETGATLSGEFSLPSAGVGVDGAALVAPVSVALLLPAVQSAREAARRTQCVNNLKQMMLAWHNYEATYGRFPDDIRDKDGKPLLSWRVAILPFIEGGELYNRFRLDEPWDSPHNLELAKRMPNVYVCPSATFGPGETSYKTFVPLDPMKPRPALRIAQFLDGTSNTMTIAESSSPVIWTKPEDVPFDFDARERARAPEELGSRHPNGFNAALADGSVRFFRQPIDPELLKALITPAGGEIIPFPLP